jgi:hypothetical protein
VVIDTASEESAQVLMYLAQRAAHAFVAKRTMRYDVAVENGKWTVTEEGDVLCVAPDSRGVLESVYQRVHQRAFELASLSGWVRVHGAFATVNGRRVLIVAESGVGKTTLSSRLLFDGAIVHGDESVVLRHGLVAAVARPFHLKPGIEHLVPELESLLPSLPALDGDPPIRAFDPTVAGFAWTIDQGPVDDVVVAARVDGPSRLISISATDAMPTIVDQVFRNQEQRRAVLREVAAVLRTARCWRLDLGAVDEAARLLERIEPFG